jgi:alkylation response protein AidB-like acyl-CoA dehydrogenase
MPFFQEPPSPGDPYATDDALRSYLDRALPEEVRREVEPELAAMGALGAGPLRELWLRGRDAEPRLTSWNAWGERIDAIELTALWQEAARIAAERGVVAAAFERRHGQHSRVHQFALAYLFDASTEMYTCPLAMTDGAAKALLAHGDAALVARAVPRLTSRDPARAWTSGQWMTERPGGSDVSLSETVARRDGDRWRLYGTKWFTSATTSQMALTLARPEGNPPGGEGLALFYVETRDAAGRLRDIVIHRLKDKLGTRMVPTAELSLEGALAIPVAGLSRGVKHIAPMLNVTRTWNAIIACAGMRRGLALARDYARRRVAFGAPIDQKPLHVDTLAALEAESRGALLLAFRVVELLGREEAGVATEGERDLARVLTPIAKLTTGKQAVAVASEVLEAFGGAGYVEDTGLPRLLRDAQVLPIWEGTTNVLSLDVVRLLVRGEGMTAIEREVAARVAPALPQCASAAGAATNAVRHARAWLEESQRLGQDALESGARRLALTLGRSLELALLVDHAAWADARGDRRPAAAARRLARSGIDLLWDPAAEDAEDAKSLLR